MATALHVVPWAVVVAFTLRVQIVAQDDLGALLEDSALSQSQSSAASVRPDQRLPVPSAAASRQALADVKDIFKDDYAKAVNPQARLALARMLLSQAEKTSAPIERWVLLSEAMRLASDAGDVDASFEAIEKSAQNFAIDVPELKLDAVMKLSAKCTLQWVV
jgi:hypothetical protein